MNCFQNVLNELNFSFYNAIDKCIYMIGKRKEVVLAMRLYLRKRFKKRAVSSSDCLSALEAGVLQIQITL